jgi:hypothetical protein
MKTKIILIVSVVMLLINVSYAQKGINLSLSFGSYCQDGYSPQSGNFFTKNSHGILTGLGINYGIHDNYGIITGINDIECVLISVYHGDEGFDHMYPQYSIYQVPLDFYYLQTLKKNENLYFRYRGGVIYNFGSTVNKSMQATDLAVKKTFDGNVKFTGGLGCNAGWSMGYDLKRWGMLELGINADYSPQYNREITLTHTTEYINNSLPAETKSSAYKMNSSSLNLSLLISYTINFNKLKKDHTS